MSHPTWKSWLRSLRSSARRPVGKAGKKGSRLQVERLEDRLTPASLYVDLTPGGAAGAAAGIFTPIGGTEVNKLTIGTNLFTSIGAATAAAASGDKIYIARDPSAYTEASAAPVANAGKSLDFIGVGADLPELRNDSARFFEFTGSDTEAVHLTLAGLRIASDGSGGGVSVLGGKTNVPSVDISTVEFVGNGSTVAGAALSTQGVVAVRNSTFVDNMAGTKGTIEVLAGGSINLVQSTVANTTGGPAITVNDGTAAFVNTTVAANAAGGVSVVLGTASAVNSLFAANGSYDLSGTWTSGGNNLFSKSPGGLGATDKADPNAALLNSAAVNGGPTRTILPKAGNPAVDGGNNIAATTADLINDQRGAGYERFVNAVDIGSVEVQNPTTSDPNQSTVGVNEKTFSITIPIPLGASSVSYTLGGTAVQGKDFSDLTPSPVRVAPGQTSVTIAGKLIDGGVYAGPSAKTLTLTYSAPTTGNPSATATYTLTITSVATRTDFPGLTQFQRFVQKLYLTELGRTGGIDEINGWAAIAASGPQGVNQTIIGIQKSVEGTNYQVKSWYALYLGRQATKAEASYWATQMRAGATEEQVIGQLLGSPEFYKRAQIVGGTGTADQRYVKALFQSLLGRSASDAEVNGWVTRLPQVGRTGIVGGLTESPEFRARLFTSYYNRLLGRNPGTPELAGWVNSPLRAGGARRAFEATPEFLGNA